MLQNPVISVCALLLASVVPTFSEAQSQRPMMPHWEDYIRSASAIARPTKLDKDKLNQDLEKQGLCAAAAVKNLPASEADGRAMKLIAAYDGDCSTGVGAIAMTVWKQSGNGVWEQHNRWVTAGAEVNLVILPKEFAPQVDQIGRFESAFQLNPFHASKLPAWTSGKIMPNLAAGLEWRGGMERDLYEAVRGGDYQIFCAYLYTMACFADLPGRNTSQTPILMTRGYADMYEAKTPHAALDVLLGKTPSLTPSQVAAKQRAVEEMVEEAARDAVSAAINQVGLLEDPTAAKKAAPQATTPPPPKKR
ncbi:MAG: hypothetical protein LW848_11420 [Hyphomonadaceae bacterium]|jgi:hypothetical protein|nr:hypothetical protein [Hyphomonadaceae bacterium]